MHNKDDGHSNKFLGTINKFRHFIYDLSEYIQYFIALAIVAAIIVTLLSLPIQIMRLRDIDSDSLIEFLKYTINVLIAIELIRVLCNRTLDTIVEILLIAITRELIIQELTTWEVLFGIIGVGILFLIRKYLFVSQLDKESRLEMHPRLGKPGINKEKHEEKHAVKENEKLNGDESFKEV